MIVCTCMCYIMNMFDTMCTAPAWYHTCTMCGTMFVAPGVHVCGTTCAFMTLYLTMCMMYVCCVCVVWQCVCASAYMYGAPCQSALCGSMSLNFGVCVRLCVRKPECVSGLCLVLFLVSLSSPGVTSLALLGLSCWGLVINIKG